jgi:uncharacterized protein
MKRHFDHLIALTVNHRTATAMLLLVISGIAFVGHWRPSLVRRLFVASKTVDAEPEELWDSAPADAPPPNVDPISLSNSNAVIVVRGDRFFTPQGARALRHVVATLDELDYVDRVLWMDRVPILNIFGLPEPLFPRSQASVARFAAARGKAMRHPLVGGQLLAEDGKTLLLLITFDWDFVRSDQQCSTELKSAAVQAAADFPDIPLEFLVTGQVPAYLLAMETHASNQVKYQAMGYGVILLMAIILFRGIRPVLIVVMAPVTGLLWTLGILNYFDIGMNPFNDVILPVLLLLVGFTDGVHLMVQIRKLRASGMDADSAIRKSLNQVGLACFLTSLTTAIGFGSLSLARHEWVQEFGWCSVIGVSLMFVSVVTVIPLVSVTPLGRNLHAGHEKSLIDRNLQKISGLVEFVLARPVVFSTLGIGLTVVFTAISLTLRPDERRSTALPESSEVAQALQHMDKVLGGLEFSEVAIRWKGIVDATSPEVLDVVTKVDELLNREPLIGYPLSIRNLIDSLPGAGSNADRFPMVELLPPPLKRAFYTPENRSATVTFRVQDLGIAKFGPVFERIQDGLERIERQHPNFKTELQGSAVWRWKNLYRMVIDLATSLGTAAGIILCVMAVAFRSIRIGLISIVPNMFPLALTGTWLALSGQPLEMVSVLAFTICLGIAVDDTIHFLTRFTEERSTAVDLPTAIRNAFCGVGVALVMTTVVLVTGFSTVAFSDSHDHHIFATMGGLTIAAALLADLIFLPAMLRCFAGNNDPPVAQSDSDQRSQSRD